MFGLIHIYCGDGKGKTTAAVGLAVRCAGRGNKVLMVQFLKSRDSGELYSLAKLPDIEVMRGKESKKFTFQMNEEEKHALLIEHNKMFEQVLAKIKNGGYSLLILDEVIGALNAKVFEMPKLIEFLRHKPENLEVVLTGRNPAPELVEIADYVSEMRKVKHPMDKGIMAREGIEK
jgi:cob(I)alamin adenosyltransferase